MKIKRFLIVIFSSLMFFMFVKNDVKAFSYEDFNHYDKSGFDTFFNLHGHKTVLEFDYIDTYSVAKKRLIALDTIGEYEIKIDKSEFYNGIRMSDSYFFLLEDSTTVGSGRGGSSVFTHILKDSILKINVINQGDAQLVVNDAQIEVNRLEFVPPSKISNVQYVFNEDNSITYTYDFPSDSDFSHLEIYQGTSLLNENFTNNSIKITDLEPLMAYTFKFISVDKSGKKSEPYESIITMPEGPDLIAPLDITNLKHVVSDSSVQFTYSLPIDDDFSHLQVYRGNDLIADNIKIASFTDENLEHETSYKYTFKSVDFTGNISNGSTLTIKTMPYNDEIAPSAPSGLVVNAGNSSLYFNWLGNSENDLAGYNVYVDGIKKNGALINSVSYRLTNLVNNQEYSIQVSAVDTSGNESALSEIVVGVPDVSKLPIFKVDNDLSPVAESVESWFSALWLPIAFSSGITLSFIVGRRIKALFFA